jgi:hypothetical protein
MSTTAQPLGTRPPVLSHRDVILNISLSQLSPQENHLEYHLKPDSTESTGVQRQETTSTQLSHRGERYTHHMGTPNTGARTQLSPEENDTPHHMGIPNIGLSHRSTQLSHRGERILENVTRHCNHQHSLLAREAFFTRPSLSQKYSNFVLASGLVKIYAIYSCIGRYCMCTAFLCTMSLI